MGAGNYISLLNSSRTFGYVSLFSSSKGGETAGSIAFGSTAAKSRFSNQGGETAGSVANSFSGGYSSCGSSGCSFSAIA